MFFKKEHKKRLETGLPLDYNPDDDSDSDSETSDNSGSDSE